MRKIFLSLAVVALTIIACQNDSSEVLNDQQAIEVDMSDFYVYTFEEDAKASKDGHDHSKCHSMKVLNRQLKENPGLENRMFNIEKHSRQFIAAKKPDGTPGGGNGGNDGGGDPEPPGDDGLGTINIPVYVHVVYNNSGDNVSDQQINSQISVLNADFNDTNYNDVPAEFQGVAADTDINFTLAGTFRHADSRTSWGTNDAVKSAYPPVTPETHLNIWVCEIGGGILGYAQFPGGNLSTDGVVILPGTLPGGDAVPYNGGRTLTHEVGHYLNLRHIWGDGRCKQDDFVSDTPSSDGPNYGCPSYPTVNCRSNDMTMNYMDYTNDDCMNMFTEGQKARMRALFAAGGARE
jgi:hypothetical protein